MITHEFNKATGVKTEHKPEHREGTIVFHKEEQTGEPKTMVFHFTPRVKESKALVIEHEPKDEMENEILSDKKKVGRV